MKILKYLLLVLAAHYNLQAQQLTPHIQWQKPKDTLIINRAVNLYDSKNFKEALKEFKKLPRNFYLLEPGVLRFAGLCHYELKNYSDAVISFSLSLAYAPEAIGTYYDRGFALMDWGKFKAAASDFAAYVIHFPEQKNAVINVSYCLARDGQMQSAINYLENYKHKDTLVYNTLALHYADQSNHGKAIEQWEKALELNPNYITGIVNLSIHYSEVNNYEKAFELIEKLIELRPSYGRAYYLRGVYFEETGDLDKAEQSFQVAREKGYERDDF